MMARYADEACKLRGARMTTHHQPSAPEAADEEPAPSWFTALERRFSVGDRVRVVPSPECQLRGIPGSYYEKIGQVGHPAFETGLTGTVTRWNHPQADFMAVQGHTIDVEYDEYPTFAPGRYARGGTYAAIELELLASAVDASVGEG